MKKKLNATDIKALVIKMPVECGTDVSWNGKTYELFRGEEIAQWKQLFPNAYSRENGELILIINVETGHIENLPENTEADFNTIKVVDCGTYTLIDQDGDVVAEYEGYVPKCLEINDNGYGDYFEFFVTDSTIEKWKWNKELFNDFLDNCDDDEDDE